MTQMMSSMTEAMVNAMQLMGNNMTNAFGFAGTGADMDSYDFGSAFGIDTDIFTIVVWKLVSPVLSPDCFVMYIPVWMSGRKRQYP